MKLRTYLFQVIVFASVTLSSYGQIQITNCSETETQDMLLMVEFVNQYWDEFEAYVESQGGVNLKGCFRRKFQENGEIYCGCRAKRINGYTRWFRKRVNFCPVFLNRVSQLKPADRKACYFALAVHEFGHSCCRTHCTINPMEEAAFEWWKDNYSGVAIDRIHCGMN